MSALYFFYGVTTILIWSAISFVTSYLHLSKFWKKHLKMRKKILFFFAIFSLALFWINLEKSLDFSTLQIIWILHFILFIGYVGWSMKKIIADYKRIVRAVARRKK